MKKGKLWNGLQLMIIFAMVAALAQNILFTDGGKVKAIETYDELCTLLSVTMQIGPQETVIDGSLEPVYVSANSTWETVVRNISITDFEIVENAECQVSYWHDSLTVCFQTEEGWVSVYNIFQGDQYPITGNLALLDDTKPYYDVKIQLYAEKDASTGLFFRIAKEHEHVYDGYTYDEHMHWKECIDPNCPDVFGSRIYSATHSGGTATCTEQAVCSVCKAKYGNVLDHTYKESITPATKKKDGKIVLVCKDCGDINSETVINKIDKAKLSDVVYVYDGTAKKPDVTVTDSKGKQLIAGDDYKISYAKGRKAVGKYNVVIKFKGHYSGTITKTFTIKPKATIIKSLTAGKQRFVLKWKKVAKQTTGYQIQYATNKKFKDAETVLVKKNTITERTVKKLSANTKYFVRIRTYQTVEIDGKKVKIYSDWSDVKKVKIQ